LSCCLEESKNEGKLTMIQPHLLNCLIQNFGEEIKGKGISLFLVHRDLRPKVNNQYGCS
jgi:hypothetical protein